MDFVFVDNKVVATEDTTAADLVIKSISEGAVVDSASNIDCNDGGCAPQRETLMASIAATTNNQ